MEEPNQTAKPEPPDGMYPARMDDRGRVKLPAAFKEYLDSLDDKKLFVTSLDRRIARIYPIQLWRETKKFPVSFPAVGKKQERRTETTGDLTSYGNR